MSRKLDALVEAKRKRGRGHGVEWRLCRRAAESDAWLVAEGYTIRSRPDMRMQPCWKDLNGWRAAPFYSSEWNAAGELLEEMQVQDGLRRAGALSDDEKRQVWRFFDSLPEIENLCPQDIALAYVRAKGLDEARIRKALKGAGVEKKRVSDE